MSYRINVRNNEAFFDHVLGRGKGGFRRLVRLVSKKLFPEEAGLLKCLNFGLHGIDALGQAFVSNGDRSKVSIHFGPDLFDEKVPIDMKREKFVRVLVHEMTHAIQFATGLLLVDEEGAFCYWKGRKRKLSDSNTDYESYLARPWEVSARCQERKAKGILREFKKI